jgi:hydroxymethylbilane synthase
VQTRLRKLDEQGMAGTVLAAAGLARLGQPSLASFAFAFQQMLPAVGQGSLAVEARADDARAAALVTPLIHERTALALRAERSLMHALQGGCQVPIAGYAEVSETTEEAGAERILLRAFAGSVDGTKVVRGELVGPAQAPEGLGLALADDLLARGADQILAEVRGAV